MSLVFKEQNLQIFLMSTSKKKNERKKEKKKQVLRDKILQVLMDLYDMQLQIFVFLYYQKALQ